MTLMVFILLLNLPRQVILQLAFFKPRPAIARYPYPQPGRAYIGGYICTYTHALVVSPSLEQVLFLIYNIYWPSILYLWLTAIKCGFGSMFIVNKTKCGEIFILTLCVQHSVIQCN